MRLAIFIDKNFQILKMRSLFEFCGVAIVIFGVEGAIVIFGVEGAIAFLGVEGGDQRLLT